MNDPMQDEQKALDKRLSDWEAKRPEREAEERADVAKHPYDPKARCPKCSYDAVTTKHMPERAYERFWMRGINYRPEHRPEHLQRTCARCEYSWKEAVVADKDEE